MLKALLISIISIWCCSFKYEVSDKILEKNISNRLVRGLVSKADSLAVEYLKELNLSSDTCYVNIEYRIIKNEVIVLSIYIGARPVDEGELPFWFKILENPNKLYATFHYCGEVEFNRDSLLSELEKGKLIIEVDEDGLVADPDYYALNDIIAWHVIICEKDMNIMKIIKSPYSLEEDQIPFGLCD